MLPLRYNLVTIPMTPVPTSQKSGKGIEALLDVEYISATGLIFCAKSWLLRFPTFLCAS